MARPEDEDLFKDIKNFIDKAISDIGTSSAKKQIILGTASGWITGFISTKLGNGAAAGFGGSVLLTHIASQTGYIDINWEKIYGDFDKITDSIEEKLTGKGPTLSTKVERFLDRKLDKAEEFIRRKELGDKSWYWDFREDGQYHATESHVFLALFVVGIALGIISG